MFSSFLTLSVQSPTRQAAFRNAVFAHLLIVLLGTWLIYLHPRGSAVGLGNALLIAGIVEGAFLVGWRLTQLPKSQSLEFLLVTPLRPYRLLLDEALVGLLRLGLVTLSGLPVLIALAAMGHIESFDVLPLMVMPFTWGAINGLFLTTWAYEPRRVRKWAERFMLTMIVIYLMVGILGGEKLLPWLDALPRGDVPLWGDWVIHFDLGAWIRDSVIAFHIYNPFAVMDYWMRQPPALAEQRMIGLQLAGMAGLVFMLFRAAGRLKSHYHELHYRPVIDESRGPRGEPGDHPLAWWAVRRVSEYSGQANLYLAAGFGFMYALYTLTGPQWPLGRAVFFIVERDMGGIPGMTSALVVLAAVPAAFQYGLWDSNEHDRCRRLELLLLTDLGAWDYWRASAAAAWSRGKGYYFVALVLWAAAFAAGQMTFLQVLAAATAGAVLWLFYFALGFRAFARDNHANHLGVLLTVAVPIITIMLFRTGWVHVGALLPPGSVYAPATDLSPLISTLR